MHHLHLYDFFHFDLRGAFLCPICTNYIGLLVYDAPAEPLTLTRGVFILSANTLVQKFTIHIERCLLYPMSNEAR